MVASIGSGACAFHPLGFERGSSNWVPKATSGIDQAGPREDGWPAAALVRVGHTSELLAGIFAEGCEADADGSS